MDSVPALSGRATIGFVRAATGTIPQLHQATSVPLRTLQRWAKQGLLTRVGSAYPARYDARQAMRIKVKRTRQCRDLTR